MSQAQVGSIRRLVEDGSLSFERLVHYLADKGFVDEDDDVGFAGKELTLSRVSFNSLLGGEFEALCDEHLSHDGPSTNVVGVDVSGEGDIRYVLYDQDQFERSEIETLLKEKVAIEERRDELRSKAQEVVGQFALGVDGSSAGIVAAALRTAKGNIYTGICIDLPSGMGFCAEHSAVAEMLKNREHDIVEIVAVSEHDVLPPCGRCREMLLQVSPKNADTIVVLPGERTARLETLLPERWVPGADDSE